MRGYVFHLTCPNCGDPLTHENAGRPTDEGRRAVAIVKCERPGCRLRFTVTVLVERMGVTGPSHGTGVLSGSLAISGVA